MKTFLFAILLLSACDKYYESDAKTELATVADAIYSPATHGSGIGVDMKLRPTFTSIDTDPVWAVVFECEHGKFVKQGSDDRDRQLWEHMKKGAKVKITYAEKIREDSNHDRHLVGYHFISAEPVP